MTLPTLVVFDESCDTANVLAAVYEPRGIAVEHQRPTARSIVQTSRPFVALRNQNRMVTIETGLSDEQPAEPASVRDPREHRLTAMFEFRELIAAVDALLTGRVAA